MKYSEIERLKNRLLEKLPAHESHSKVMQHRKSLDQLGELPQGARRSAVLILLYPTNEELHTVFILRQSYKGVHSGQIGLPGGKVEPEDISLRDTALREANEELNIQREELELLGELSPLYVPPSNFVIHPFVAFQQNRPEFVPQEREVAAIIEYPIKELLGEEKLIDTTVEVINGKLKVKGFNLQEKILWGATAMIIQELIDVLES